MNCWKCSKSIGDLPLKISFRASCPHCSSDLHTCTNCRYYLIGKPNDCAVPGTESIRDREAANFCEEFKVRTTAPPPPSSAQKFKSLFKEEEE